MLEIIQQRDPSVSSIEFHDINLEKQLLEMESKLESKPNTVCIFDISITCACQNWTTLTNLVAEHKRTLFFLLLDNHCSHCVLTFLRQNCVDTYLYFSCPSRQQDIIEHYASQWYGHVYACVSKTSQRPNGWLVLRSDRFVDQVSNDASST